MAGKTQIREEPMSLFFWNVFEHPVAIEPLPVVIICRWQIIFPLRSKALRAIAFQEKSCLPLAGSLKALRTLRFVSFVPSCLNSVAESPRWVFRS